MWRALAVFSILLSLAAPAAAEAAKAKVGAPIVAVVDVQLILREAAAAKAVRQAVEARRASFEKELDKETQELRRAEEELRKAQAQLAPDALAERKRELERRFGELRRRTDERRGLLSEAYNAAMRQVRQEMARALAEIMRERRIDVSMSRTAVLIFDEKLDITQEVLTRLNRRLPKVDVRFDAPPAASAPPQN
jgi:Skp family chaperone for outer membrane proteins